MSFLTRLRQRGVLRVAFSYAVIGWLTLQIGDVVLEPLGAPPWVMRALIALVAAGFPVALLLAWFFELTPQGIELDRLPEGTARPAVRGLRHYADVAIIGVLALTVVFLLLRQSDWIEGESGPPVIGVLPFTELGTEATADSGAYFGSGLADTLTYKLGLLKQLIVLAPTSTNEFHGQGLDLKAVGLKLGATALLEGKVRRAAGVLRVNARLVDIASGQQLWSGSYDRSGTDLFAVQDEIATAVTEALQVVLTVDDESRLTKKSTSSLTAYDAYLKAQPLLATRLHDNMQPAVDYLREATRIDPDYALAWSGLAEALTLASGYGSLNWETSGEEARSAAARAKALDPQLGEAYFAEAQIAMFDNDYYPTPKWPEGLITGLLQHALDLNPNDAKAFRFLAAYEPSTEKRLKLAKQAAQLDPESGMNYLDIAMTYVDLGQYDEAQAWAKRALSVTNPPAALVYGAMSEMMYYDRAHLLDSARWALDYQHQYPQAFDAFIHRLRTMNELGAWRESREIVDDLPDLGTAANGLNRRDAFRLLQEVRLARIEKDWKAVAILAQRFVDEVLKPGQQWPMYRADGPFRTVFEAWALADINMGKADVALRRYREAYPDPEEMMLWNLMIEPLRAPVLFAILHRLNGDGAEAERLLRNVLERVKAEPIQGINGMGFTRFTIHAFLGESEAAIAELEAAVKAGWGLGWWGLKDGGFDPNYAAVVADPRFVKLYGEIEARVKKTREDFFAHPELPEASQIP